jgi:hypothetical protein
VKQTSLYNSKARLFLQKKSQNHEAEKLILRGNHIISITLYKFTYILPIFYGF